MQRELKIFNGIFVMAFILVILNNAYFVSAMYGIVEASGLGMYTRRFPQFVILRMPLTYDIYFFSIGFTTCVKLWTNYY